MQENTRNISARVGAVSAVALLAVSGAFIAGPAMAGEITPSATPSPTDTSTATPAPTDTSTATPAPTDTATPTPTPTPTGTATPTQTPTPSATATAPAVLDAPTVNLKNGDVIKTNTIITGTAPGATSVELTANGVMQSIPVAEDGTWNVMAPTFAPEGATLSLSIVAVAGETRSAATTVVVTMENAPLPTPEFTTPVTVEGSLNVVSGRGVPEATITLTITADGTAPFTGATTVDENGLWEMSLAQPLGYGVYDLAAVQSMEGKDNSQASISIVYVVPSAPVVTTPGNGAEIPVNKMPAAISGTAVPGADVELVVDFDLDGEADVDETAIQATVADASGNWSVPLSPLAEGAHNIVAIQAVGEAISDFSDTGFTVTAAVVDPPVAVNPVPVGNPGAGGLPDTGAANLGLLAGGGAALLTAGGAALLFNRRRNAASES